MSEGERAAPSGHRRLRLVVLGATLLLASILVAVALAEVLVRFAAPQQLIQSRPDLWQPADTLGWVVRPNVSTRINTGERTVSVFTDRDGFRVGRTGRRDAVLNVLLIGDSFMQALQVEHEESVASLLETDLSSQLGQPAAVRNAGVDGWGPNHYRLRTQQLLARDTFDLVVVCVFVGNDAVAERIDYIPARAPAERHLLRMPRALSWGEIVAAWFAPANDALEQRSHLFTLVKNEMSALRMKLGLTAEYFPYEYRREQLGSPRWAATAQVAAAQAGFAAERGVPTLFVLIPERFQVYKEAFDDYIKGFDIDPSAVDLEQPTRELLRAFQANRLDVIDALPAFRAAIPSSPPLFDSKLDTLPCKPKRPNVAVASAPKPQNAPLTDSAFMLPTKPPNEKLPKS